MLAPQAIHFVVLLSSKTSGGFCRATALQLYGGLTFDCKAQSGITWIALDQTEGVYALVASQDGSIQCFSTLVRSEVT